MAFTNAATIIEEGFQDTEDLAGRFSGFDQEDDTYDAKEGHWGYRGSASDHDGGGAQQGQTSPQKQDSGGPRAPPSWAGPRRTRGRGEEMTSNSPAGQLPRDLGLCNTWAPLRHADLGGGICALHAGQPCPSVCGCKPEELERVAELLCVNSGREKTSAIVYALGWTQHTTGVQMIRTCRHNPASCSATCGRPGGGIMGHGGHSSIQGSTDIATLYDLLPGYLPQPSADRGHETLDSYVAHEGLPTGYWANFRKFIISFLKAYYGDAATPEKRLFAMTGCPASTAIIRSFPYFDRR